MSTSAGPPVLDFPIHGFCGHCGKRPDPEGPAQRVCPSCQLGLVIGAPESVAPRQGEAFLVVDGKLQICAVSRGAEKVLGAAETEVVNQTLTDVLLPADAEAAGIESLVSTIVHAARGEGAARSLVVRPAGEWGIRWFARVGPCGAPSAALLVLALGG